MEWFRNHQVQTFGVLRWDRDGVDVDGEAALGGLDQLVEALGLPEVLLRLLDLSRPFRLQSWKSETLFSHKNGVVAEACETAVKAI